MAGKLFTLVWNKFVARKRPSDGTGELGDGVVDQQESLFMSILFAALSAAVGAAVSQLSDRGSKALVARRHRRNPTDNHLASSSALSPCIFYAHQPVLRL